MLSIRKLQKGANEPKLHQGKTCINHKKVGQKVVNRKWEQCCEILQPAKFAGCEFSQPCKISTDISFSLAFLLQISSGSIMHLRIRLGFIIFESD